MNKFLLPFIVALVAGLAACAGDGGAKPAGAHTERPGVIMEVQDDSLDPYRVMWQREIARRFPAAVAIFCHGGEYVEGQWTVEVMNGNHQTQLVSSVVRHYQDQYPGRTIVLLACNPGHLRLNIPGVYYSHSSVWCVPDRDLEGSSPGASLCTLDRQIAGHSGNRSRDEPDNVGNIFEFIAD